MVHLFITVLRSQYPLSDTPVSQRRMVPIREIGGKTSAPSFDEDLSDLRCLHGRDLHRCTVGDSRLLDMFSEPGVAIGISLDLLVG